MRFAAAAGVVCVLVSICSIAKADPFSFYSIQGSKTTSLLGIDGQGDVLTSTTLPAAGPLNATSWAIQNPQQSAFSSFTYVPTFSHDDGAACTPGLPTGVSVIRAACNGVYAIASIEDGVTDPSKLEYSLRFFGPQFAASGYVIQTGRELSIADNIKLNANGDFAIDNGFTERQYEGFLTATPEPSSIALLGSGAVGLLGMMRRRVTAK